MKLIKIIEKYITFKRSLGLQFIPGAIHLKSFARITGNIDIEKVKTQTVLSFIVGRGPVTLTWYEKFKTIRGFYRFAIGRGYGSSYPLPKVLPKMPEPFIPYLYTTEEIRRLLSSVGAIGKNSKPNVDAITLSTLLLLLYGAGLRISEALSLKLADVNLSECLLTIRHSKFSKSRWVPIGTKLAQALCVYMKERQHLHRRLGRETFFS